MSVRERKKPRGAGSTGPKHKTELDRDRTREEVARLQAFGYTSREISTKLGGRVSHVTVCKYIDEVAHRYRTSQLASREQYVAEKLEQIRLLRLEATEAWVRSKTSDDPEITKSGDATFLRVVAELLRDERELLGLDAPKKSQTASVNVNVDGGAVVGFDALADVEPVEAEIERVKALPPKGEE